MDFYVHIFKNKRVQTISRIRYILYFLIVLLKYISVSVRCIPEYRGGIYTAGFSDQVLNCEQVLAKILSALSGIHNSFRYCANS